MPDTVQPGRYRHRTPTRKVAPFTHLKNGLGNLAACGVEWLAAIVKNRLKRVQYRPELIDGFLAQTKLTLAPQPP